MQLLDSLRSLVTGLGSAKDKTVSQAFVTRFVDDAELNSLHRSDWLARKIVDIIPNDMTREWRDWQADEGAIEKIEAVEKSPLVNLQLRVNQALQKARLFGGAAIYMGMKDGSPDQPLDLERVKAGDLLYLHVMTCREVASGELNLDITSEFYGQPSYYLMTTGVNAAQVKIHPSRIVRFVGAEILDPRMAVGNTLWGDSVLQILYDAVQNAASVQQHIAALIPEAKCDVIYIPGLAQYASTDQGQKTLTNRFTYANSAKSLFNMILLDGDGENGGERWEQKQINFANLPEVIAQFLQIASGAADIPVTRLIGQSPKGLNATGESDIRNYYDNIAARQRTELQPALFRLDEVIIRSALGSRDPKIYYEWAPLWGLSDTEKAANFKTKADAARAIAGGTGQQPLIPIEALSDALVNMLVEDGTLPGLQDAIDEYGKLSEQDPSLEEQVAALASSAVKPNQTQAPAGE